MKKLLLVLVLIGGLIAVGNAVTRAGGVPEQPQLTATPNSGPPAFELTLMVTGCFAPEFEEEFVTFLVADEVAGTDWCESVSGGTSASVTSFAPTEPGQYEVKAIIDEDEPRAAEVQELDNCADPQASRPCELTSSITVVEASLTATPDSGGPGFDFDLSLDGCRTAQLVLKQLQTAENVTFAVPWLGEDGVVETTCADGQAGATGFTAPDEAGTYDVFAVLEGFELQVASGHDELIEGVEPCSGNGSAYADFEPCYVQAEITVDEPPPVTDPPVTDPPVTDPPTTDPPATTAAPTTTVDDGAGVPAPTEPPVVELPATGTSGNTGVTALAILLLLAGGGLVVLGTRRRTSGEER